METRNEARIRTEYSRPSLMVKKEVVDRSPQAKAVFSRRCPTLMKKARELSTLCNVNVCIICFDSDGTLTTWPENRSQVTDAILQYKKQCNKLKDQEIGPMQFGVSDVASDDEILGKLSEEELVRLHAYLESKIRSVDQEIEALRKAEGDPVAEDHPYGAVFAGIDYCAEPCDILCCELREQAQAYEPPSDTEKHEIHDLYYEYALKRGMAGGHDPSDIFRSFFEGGGNCNGFNSGASFRSLQSFSIMEASDSGFLVPNFPIDATSQRFADGFLAEGFNDNFSSGKSTMIGQSSKTSSCWPPTLTLLEASKSSTL